MTATGLVEFEEGLYKLVFPSLIDIMLVWNHQIQMQHAKGHHLHQILIVDILKAPAGTMPD